MKTKFVLFLLSISALWGCSQQASTEKYLSERNNVVNVHDKVVEIHIDEPYISSIFHVFIMDKYLFITDYQNADGHIHIFDKNTFQYIANIAPKGHGPYEFVNIGEICPDEKNRKFYVFDFGKYKLLSYDLDSVIHDPSYRFHEKTSFKEPLYPYKCCYINDTLSLVSIVDVENNYRNVNILAGLWNMCTGELRIGYENPSVKKKRFQFDASEEEGIYVKSYSRYDLMTICNLDGSLKCNVYGPAWSKEITNICHYNMDIRICKDKILALYSGADHRSPDHYPSKIHIFDTAGNYIKTLETGFHILSFQYDKEKHRIIFGTNDEMQFGYLDLEGLL
ncbi:BF3164 family lipoprotein [Odoribacter lunatus]|uniref:BF3164 family lipoprotein n=1 Tax=Odoribacter lunatus TaxID=2941335 RepID=UPI00204131C6|nr:BF3164 family lipoprotein [Odoribacter lunatus]